MKVLLLVAALGVSACGSKEAADKPPPPKEALPAPAPLPTLADNAPKDKPVTGMTESDFERAVAPYIEQGKKSYQEAKARYLAGLPAGHHFFATTTLKSSGKSESVFIAVSEIKDGNITGAIASDIISVTGYKQGDAYRFPETELTDWMIARPDGSEEGNVVGKFLDDYQKRAH